MKTSSTKTRPFRVGRSKTGLGLFAIDDLRKGDFIVEYTGPLIDNDEAERRRRSRYLFELNSRWTVDGAPRSNLGRYINHSCRPNAEAYITRGRIKIRARKRIPADEEITYDYGKAHFDEFIKPKGCRCTSCMRKKLNGAKKLNGTRKLSGTRKLNGSSKTAT